MLTVEIFCTVVFSNSRKKKTEDQRPVSSTTQHRFSGLWRLLLDYALTLVLWTIRGMLRLGEWGGERKRARKEDEREREEERRSFQWAVRSTTELVQQARHKRGTDAAGLLVWLLMLLRFSAAAGFLIISPTTEHSYRTHIHSRRWGRSKGKRENWSVPECAASTEGAVQRSLTTELSEGSERSVCLWLAVSLFVFTSAAQNLLSAVAAAAVQWCWGAVYSRRWKVMKSDVLQPHAHSGFDSPNWVADSGSD